MVHLFSQSEHVSNIQPATNPIKVHCNKGTVDTTQEADFGDTLVYFDARGIANVLSLYQLGQKFKVTYDSTDRGGVFKVLTPAGVVEFKPTQKGLHVLNLKHNPDAAFILANGSDLAYGELEYQLSARITKVSPNARFNKQLMLAASWG
jgi:hypothetical protein